jgi:hypothetical protein
MLEMPVETLKEIQNTAVKASNIANIQDVQIGRYKYRRILADGTFIDTEIEPDALNDTLASLDDLVIRFQQFPRSEIWIDRDQIWLLYDVDKRHFGTANLKIELSKVVEDLFAAEICMGTTVTPDEFEEKAMMMFDLPEDFLNEIRALQWRKKKETVKMLENASKSMSADELEIVLTADNEVFRGRNFIVTTPIIVVPYQTSTEVIQVKLIVNAKKETITYAPKTGTMEKLYQKAYAEIRDTILNNYKLDRNRIFCGMPASEKLFAYKIQK